MISRPVGQEGHCFLVVTMAVLYPETGCWLNTPLQYVTNEMERCRDTAKDTGQSN